jgi:hypothetical protein
MGRPYQRASRDVKLSYGLTKRARFTFSCANLAVRNRRHRRVDRTFPTLPTKDARRDRQHTARRRQRTLGWHGHRYVIAHVFEDMLRIDRSGHGGRQKSVLDRQHLGRLLIVQDIHDELADIAKAAAFGLRAPEVKPHPPPDDATILNDPPAPARGTFRIIDCRYCAVDLRQ